MRTPFSGASVLRLKAKASPKAIFMTHLYSSRIGESLSFCPTFLRLRLFVIFFLLCFLHTHLLHRPYTVHKEAIHLACIYCRIHNKHLLGIHSPQEDSKTTQSVAETRALEGTRVFFRQAYKRFMKQQLSIGHSLCILHLTDPTPIVKTLSRH